MKTVMYDWDDLLTNKKLKRLFTEEELFEMLVWIKTQPEEVKGIELLNAVCDKFDVTAINGMRLLHEAREL